MMLKNLRIIFKYSQHTKYCIIGGGTGGVNTAAHLLRRKIGGRNIRIFQPSQYHYYQPGWTMVGNSLTDPENTRKPMQQVIPESTHWTKQKVIKIEPINNKVFTEGGRSFTYDHLIISTGFQNDWNKIKGAKQLLDNPRSNVCSIYDFNYAQKTAKVGERFTGGKAIFTEPALPIKCAGAPQKILYLWTSQWRKNRIQANVQFIKNAGVLFGVPKYSESLTKIAENYHIGLTFKNNLVQVSKDQAIFEHIETKERMVKPYDFLHIVPPMSAPSFLKQSGVTNEAGFVDVDKHTLRHNKFSNIWSLGDSSSLPCSKTAAAIFSQQQALVDNLVYLQSNPGAKQLPGKYDGYSSCPLFVGGKQLMLAEFKYDGVIDETFYNDQQKPRKLFYYLKKYFFPIVYWKLVPRGLWNGRKGIRWV